MNTGYLKAKKEYAALRIVIGKDAMKSYMANKAYVEELEGQVRESRMLAERRLNGIRILSERGVSPVDILNIIAGLAIKGREIEDIIGRMTEEQQSLIKSLMQGHGIYGDHRDKRDSTEETINASNLRRDMYVDQAEGILHDLRTGKL